MTSTTRLVSIPLYHLEAEVAAYPLAAERAFGLGLVALSPRLQRGDRASLTQRDTATLWRDAEQRLLANTPALSVDEALNFRDLFWFAEADGRPALGDNIPLETYLVQLTRRFLQRNGNEAELVDTSRVRRLTPSELRWRWRWLSFALPPDLLLAALDPETTPPATLRFLNPLLETQLFSSGYVEPHLHLNAGYDFKLLWTALTLVIGNPGILNQFRSPGAALDEGENFGSWLIRAILARWFLASYLSSPDPRLFTDWLNDVLRGLRVRLQDPYLPLTMVAAFRELGQGQFQETSPSGPVLQRLYRIIVNPRQRIVSYDGYQAFDPIAELAFGNGPFAAGWAEEATPEMRFTARGLRYLQQTPDDQPFARLFWQYQRVRVLFFRHVIQRPMTAGLQWFTRFFSRLGPPRRGVARAVTLRSAALNDGLGHGLQSFEFRFGPPNSFNDGWIEFQDFIQTINSLKGTPGQGGQNAGAGNTGADVPETGNVIQNSNSLRSTPTQGGQNAGGGNRGADVPEFGIVIHFPKQRGDGFIDGIPQANWREAHADPEAPRNAGYRYGRYYRQQRRSAEVLGRLIRSFPTLLQTVRGLDICTDEQGVPTWVFVPIFRFLRECADLAAGQLPPVPLGSYRLRATVHSGEDFIHLATGLRHIHEALVFLPLREGDRIGHGMALGTDPERWATQNGRVLMTWENRFFDLLWEQYCFEMENLSSTGGRRTFVEQELRRLSRELGYTFTLAQDMIDWYTRLHSEVELEGLGFPLTSSIRGLELSRTMRGDPLYRHLTDGRLFLLGKSLVHIDPSSEIEALNALQEHVKGRLSDISATIEVNPSSNLLIGHLTDMEDHPLWRLVPFTSDAARTALPVCIGADDQITFNTDVRAEYQLLDDCLLRMGVDEVAARNALNRIREDGLEARFTLPLAQHRPLESPRRPISPGDTVAPMP